MTQARILIGNCAEVLGQLPDASVHACVTSPPYYRLRKYDAVADWPEISYIPLPGMGAITIPAQTCELGLEDDFFAYVGHLVHVFRQIRRVLRADGSCWLNLGDGWATRRRRWGSMRKGFHERYYGTDSKKANVSDYLPAGNVPLGLKDTDLIGTPWRVAFALQADGWYLRSEVIWHKKNCMPDPTESRPTRAHETIFQLTKEPTYFHDAFAIREAHTMRPQRRPSGHKTRQTDGILPPHTWKGLARAELGVDGHPAGRNARSVWSISTTPFKEAHFAVMPTELALRCIRAATSERGVCSICGAPVARIVERPEIERPGKPARLQDQAATADNQARRGQLSGEAYQRERDANPLYTLRWDPSCGCEGREIVPAQVLDPFAGAGTTALAALSAGRAFVGVEFNTVYAAMAKRRLDDELGGLLAQTTVQASEPEPTQVDLFADE